MAREHGISDVMIDIGQDIRVTGHSPEKTPGTSAWKNLTGQANAGPRCD